MPPREETAVNHLPPVPVKYRRCSERSRVSPALAGPPQILQRWKQEFESVVSMGSPKAPPSISQPQLGSLTGRFPPGSQEGEGLLLAEDPPGT